MSTIHKSAATATRVTLVIAAALAIFWVVPIEMLNALAFWVVEISILFIWFSTDLPVGTGNNGFVVPNTLGFLVLAGLIWITVFLFGLLTSYANRGRSKPLDRRAKTSSRYECDDCDSTGWIRVGGRKSVCDSCRGLGGKSPPNISLERRREG